MPRRFDELLDREAKPLVTWEELAADYPMSEPHAFVIDGKEYEFCFGVVSSNDKRELKRQAHVYIAREYAEQLGLEVTDPQVVHWMNSVQGQEEILDEYRLRYVVATTYYLAPSGKPARALDEEAVRARFTDEMLEELDAYSLAHQERFDPATWDIETFSEMVEVAKKNDPDSLARLIRFGTTQLSTSLRCIVTLSSESQIMSWFEQLSGQVSQDEEMSD